MRPMNIFGQNLGIAQLLIPAICAGALVTANMYFLHISFHRQNKIHISMSIAGLLSLIYVVTHLLALIVGGILLRPDAGVQLYRAEQIFLTFFLFAFPYSITNLLAVNEQWQRINKSISLFGLAVACCITVIAFLFPDEFMSTTRKSGVLLNAAAFHGRGQEGVLCAIRDIVFSILILYGAVCFAADLFMKKQL